eukprot:7226020-Pyramimonas_sp.AAC.1
MSRSVAPGPTTKPRYSPLSWISIDAQDGMWRCNQSLRSAIAEVAQLAVERDQHAFAMLQVEARQHPRRLESPPEPRQQLPSSENSSHIISTHSLRRKSALGEPHHAVGERVHHDGPQRARCRAALNEPAGDAREVHQCARQLHIGRRGARRARAPR